jgi:uncharacterized protein
VKASAAALLLVAATWPGSAGVGAAAPAEEPVPFLSGRVVDEAGLVPSGARERMEAKLAALEQATGAQVVVLTVESLGGEPIENYTHRVAETWKLGRKEQDDGALLFVARADRKMRIEVGYGLEDRLTDLRSRRILDDVVAPRFKAGDFGGGLEEGVNAIEAVVRGGEVTAEVPPAPVAPASGEMDLAGRLMMGLVFVMTAGAFSVLALFLPAAAAWLLYVFLMPFHCLFPGAILSRPVGLGWFALWVIGFPLARWWVGKTGRGSRWSEWFTSGSGGGWTSGRSWRSSDGGSWSSSSSSDSSFSGGGGSFGGGGASSSW